jgi:S1-C subfamily serine protease
MVVTNLHVVADCQPADIEIYLANGLVLNPKQIWRDEETDIAVLDPGREDLPAVRMGDSEGVRIGQWVVAIGSPFGLSQSVTHGIISAKHRRQIGIGGKLRIKEFLQTDAAINPGSSGGPLLNLDGEVIGINTAIASRTGSSSGVAFSIPINLVRWVTDDLLAYGKVRRGFLGVEFPIRFSHERAQGLGLAVARGALISHVHPGTPADRAGLRIDDVVMEFGGVPIEDENHLINAVSQTEVGKPVEVIVWRDGAKRRLLATLSSWETFQPATETATQIPVND